MGEGRRGPCCCAGVTSPLWIRVDTVGVSFLALKEHHRSLKASQWCGRVSRPVCCGRGGLGGQLWFCVGSIPSGQEGPLGSGRRWLSRGRWGYLPVKGRRTGRADGRGLGPRPGREVGQGRGDTAPLPGCPGGHPAPRSFVPHRSGTRGWGTSGRRVWGHGADSTPAVAGGGRSDHRTISPGASLGCL